MSDELTQEAEARPRMGVNACLWIGVLLPPLIWAIQMQLIYWAVRGACVRESNIRLYSVTTVALLLIVGSGMCAWFGSGRSRGREQAEWGAVISNSRFMFALGILSCAVFFLAVIAQGVALTIFNPCQL